MATYQVDSGVTGETGVVIRSISNRSEGPSFLTAGDQNSSLYDFGAWLLFTNVAIAQGSTIDTAYLQCYAASVATIGDMVIEAEDEDEGTFPTTFAQYDSKNRTTASVTWSPGAWSNTTWYDSDSIVSVIQEIVDRPGWVSGNDLLIFCDNATA
ncbi:MAG: hypothetical protein GY771_00840, partial [bacterium]|nr:hypothetical protein [bacterium]